MKNNNSSWQQLIIKTEEKYTNDISNWLQLKGALSVTLIDAGDQPIYEPPPNATPLWNKIEISALFKTDVNIDTIVNQLNYDFSSDIVESYEHKIINHNHANDKYDFEPVCFANKLWIYPYGKHPNKDNEDQKDRYYINLEPGLAFGSGEHPTTALCLEWLADNITGNNHNSTIIDYGSGSGILSLAAIKLGVGSALAVDNDPQAILSTSENAKRNQISENISTFFPSELPPIEADFIVANILANPLMELAPVMVNHLKNGGKIVLSGILQEQTDFVALSYMNCGITITDIKRKGAWVRIVGVK